VFEEGGLPRREFLDVYGAMTISGVPKPAWMAFKLLHQHAGNRRLPTTVGPQGNVSYISAMATANGTATNAGNALRVFLSFWGNPDTCCNATSRTIHLTVDHGSVTAVPAKAQLYVLDDSHGNVQALWRTLGAPNQPSAAQLAQLRAGSAAGVIAASFVASNGTATTVTVDMSENSAVVVEYMP
jgi:xylan 1,4-beta-xylosidase